MTRESICNQARNQRGQVAVEYILLLVVVVALYTTIMNTVTKRDPNGDPANSGFIIQAWSAIVSTIGQDYADDPNP